MYVGTPSGRVLWFGWIPTTVLAITPTVTPPTTHVDTTLTPTEIPTISPIVSPSPDYTPASHDYSPTSDTEPDPFKDLTSDRIPPLPATSPFISSTDDSSDNDTLDTPPPPPTHEIPLVEVTLLSSQLLPTSFGVRHRRVTILSLGQPIPYGRPDSSSETSSDSSSDPIYDYSSGHSSFDHSSQALPSGMRSSHQLCSSVPSIPHSSAAITKRPSNSSSKGPSCKRSRSPTTYVPLSSPGALSSVRVDLLPPRKRIRSSDFMSNLEDCSDESSESSVLRETSLRDDVDVEGSDEPYSGPDIDLEVQAEIDKCIAYADALRAVGI
ncbi:hypothetical protein Tco_1469039, partial [Tanacetum coccineum]